MAIDTTWVRYGAPAAEALWRAVGEAKAGDPLAPVTVVVPSNHVGVAARRQLASGAGGPVCPPGVGLAAVTFATVFRLGELLGAPALAAQGRRPVSTPVVAAAVRAALTDAPGMFAPVAAHPATEAALVATYRELRTVGPAALAALAARGPRASDVVRLHRAVRAGLADAWYDEDDLLAAATEAITGGPPADIGSVVVFLPQRATAASAALLRALAIHRRVHVLAGTAVDAGADAEVVDALRLVDPDAPAPPSAPDALAGIVHGDRTRIVLTADADDEVRAAVRTVVAASVAGTPFDRMAVLYASPSPYARLVHEHLAAAAVPTNGAAVVPLAGRVVGRTLLGLLAWPDDGYRRSDLMALLSAAPVRHEGRPAPVGAWERVARDAAVVAGAAQWDQRLAAHAAAATRWADTLEADPDAPPARARRARVEAAHASRLRTVALGLVAELDRASGAPRPWEEHVSWARRLLEELLGDDTDRRGWPAEEVRAGERVDAALARLGALGAIEGPVSLEVFARTLTLELESDLARVGRFGEGVLVGSVGLATGLDLELVVVLGLAEGTFPTTPGDDSLLPDHDRAAIGLPQRRAAVGRQHRELLAALAGARHHHLGAPRGDLRRSSTRVPSRWLLDAAGALIGGRVGSGELATLDVGGLEHVASFDAGLRGVAVPATAQEHRLRTQMAGGDAAATGDALVARGLEVLTARRSPSFTRFDGNLAGLPVPSPVERTTTATRLERWALCPFHYFVRDVLGVTETPDPDEELRITPIDKGNLVHEVLERFLHEVLERPAPPGPDEPWTPTDRDRLAALADDVCRQYEAQGQVGRALFWRRDRAAVLHELQRVLELDDVERAARRCVPVAAELAFGGRHQPPVAVALPDGRALRVHGKADRVDLGADGTLHVVDYKTGGTSRYTGLRAEAPDGAGRHLQLVIYALAARAAFGQPHTPVEAEYWFVSTKAGFRRIGYAVTDEVLARVTATMGRLVSGIERGTFPPHPELSTTSPFPCPSCDPDRLGVAELRRGWERKRADPVLGAYADLVEPLDGPGPDEEDSGDA